MRIALVTPAPVGGISDQTDKSYVTYNSIARRFRRHCLILWGDYSEFTLRLREAQEGPANCGYSRCTYTISYY